jgi:hypothetical protein
VINFNGGVGLMIRKAYFLNTGFVVAFVNFKEFTCNWRGNEKFAESMKSGLLFSKTSTKQYKRCKK